MKTYTGGCHCKTVRYETQLDLTQPVLECNCSHCQMQGALLCFVPANTFNITAGEDLLVEYRFNTNKIEHLHCPKCGIEAFGRVISEDGEGTIAVNVRTVDNVELETLTRKPVDGKSF